MPLSVDNVIQMNSGSGTSTGFGSYVAVTLSSATTAGSTIIIVATCDGDNATTGSLEGPQAASPPFSTAYFTETGADTWNQMAVWVQRNNGGGNTTWNLETTGTHAAQQVVWIALELTGIGLDPFPLVPNFPEGWVAFPSGKTINNNNTGTTSWSTGTTHQTACYDVLGLAFHSATSTTGTIPTFSNRTNGFLELITATRADATHAMALTISYLPTIAIRTFECTVDVSPSSYTCGYVLAFYGDGARFAPDYLGMFGAEIGSATNIAVISPAVLNTGVWDTVTGSPAIVSTSPRSGTYALELSSSAATENLTWSAANNGVLSSYGSAYCSVGRFNVYFPTSLPGSDVELWYISVGGGGFAGVTTIRYRTASQKIGIQVGSGTEVLSDATVSANTWIGIDYRLDTSPDSNVHTCDWQVDYNSATSDTTASVVQTQAVGAGTTKESIDLVRCGWNTARTATVRYDDIVVSRLYGNYPIGDTRILPLKVDTGGTCTVTGSSANFRTFTSNGGTLTAWTSANTLAALDDIPPTIGAASDGLTQITAATGDFVKIPMETYDAAANDMCLRAVRWYVAGWAATTTTATIAVRAGDNASVLWSVADGDHNFDSTTQRWLCGPQRVRADLPPYILTQAKLDATYLEMGGSVDATPDIGIHAVLAELAVQPVNVFGVLDAEGSSFNVYIRQDPKSDAAASYLVTTPAGTRGATFEWTQLGVDDSLYVGPNTTGVASLAASTAEDVTSITLRPDDPPA